MNNQRELVMKRIVSFVAILPFFAIVSCSNKEALPVSDETFTPLVIGAVVDEEMTKTTYTLNGEKYTFAWVPGDKISVQLYNGDNVNQLPFTTQSSTASATFTQDVGTFDLTTDHSSTLTGINNRTYTLGDFAFYPRFNMTDLFGLEYSGSGTGKTTDYVIIHSSEPYQASNPAKVIPMLGYKESGDGTFEATYKFKAATGVLKFTVNNIPAGASKITITSKNNTDVLAGKWELTDESLLTSGLTMESVKSGTGTNSKTITFSGLDGTNRDFFIPIPVGTVHGLIIDLKTEDDVLLYRVSLSSDIVIERAVVTSLKDIEAKMPAITISGLASSPVLNYNKDGSSLVNKFCAYISTEENHNFSKYESTFVFSNESGKYDLISWPGGSSAISTNQLEKAGSGKFYLHWLAVSRNVENASTLSDLSDSRIKAYGKIPFYYLSLADGANLVGTYNATQNAQDWWGSSTHTDCVIIEAQSALEGNKLTIPYFRGRAYDKNHRGLDKYYPYTDSTIGTPVYGSVSGSTLLFSSSENFSEGKFFVKTNNWEFYVVSSETGLDGQNLPTSANGDISFAIEKNDDKFTLRNTGYIDFLFNYNRDGNWYAFWSFQNLVLTQQ